MKDSINQIGFIKFNDAGLVPVITQDYLTKDVLMLAYASKESIELTLKTGYVHYFSRSRNRLWKKGESSGHFQLVKEIRYDCDGDTMLIFCEQIGVACHTGKKSCFYNRMYSTDKTSETETDISDANSPAILSKLYEIIQGRQQNPVEGSYTNYLLDKGVDKILKKVGEEASEVIIASKNADKTEITAETADLIFHLSVLLVERGVVWTDVFAELRSRMRG